MCPTRAKLVRVIVTILENMFNERFAKQGIVLPGDAVSQRARGRIIKAGWCIWFLFGIDDQGEYLDCYSSHRMVLGDEHIRLRTDGSEETLPSICDLRRLSPDPVEDAQLEKAFFAENQQISEMLKTKGFGIEDDEPMSAQINRALSTGELK